MAARDHNGDERPSRTGYLAAILTSALGHAAIFALVFFVAPNYLQAPEAAPPAYTVKIVDDIPAGDLGTHLPRINRHKTAEAKLEAAKPEEPKVKVEPPKPPELAPADDKNAIALNTTKFPETPTPTPEPTPEPTIEVTPEPTPAPTEKPKPPPKRTHTPRPAPSSEATPHPAKREPKAAPSIVIAKADATPSVEDRLASIKRKLLEEHLKNAKKEAEEDESDSDEADEDTPPGPTGGGPVTGKVASAGTGMGIGPGSGSAGIQQDLDFLLYYQTVQDRIKKAWNFTGGSNELAATVDFSIGPDGALTAVKIGQSSKDSAFDDSVIRAIRRAAPFAPPPDKFRDRFSAGIEALFKLGELKS